MVSLGALAGVAALSLGVVLTPGPNLAYLISRTLTQGRRAGLVSLAGVALGFVCYLCPANLGLSVLFVAVPELYLTIKLAGASTSAGWPGRR